MYVCMYVCMFAGLSPYVNVHMYVVLAIGIAFLYISYFFDIQLN